VSKKLKLKILPETVRSLQSFLHCRPTTERACNCHQCRVWKKKKHIWWKKGIVFLHPNAAK
jgi:hypothetical protein